MSCFFIYPRLSAGHVNCVYGFVFNRVEVYTDPGLAGPYYQLGTIGTVPRAYDISRAYEGMEGRKISMKKQENLIQNRIQDFKNQNSTLSLRMKW
jgi:hypothetical protein